MKPVLDDAAKFSPIVLPRALFFLFLAAVSVSPYVDPDLWWHLRMGDHLLSRGWDFRDTSSFTFAGQSWIDHEWLAQAVMALIFKGGSFPGLALFFAALVMLIFGLAYANVRRYGSLGIALTLLAVSASEFSFGMRPHLFSLLMLVLFQSVIEKTRREPGSLKNLFWLPLLSVFWCNLHAGFFMGIGLLAVYGAADLWVCAMPGRAAGRNSLRIPFCFFLTAVLCFLATALNPHGLELWKFPLTTVFDKTPYLYIVEWQAVDWHKSRYWPFGILAVLGIFGCLRCRGRAGPAEILIFFGAASAAMISERHIPAFAVLSIPILSRMLSAEGQMITGKIFTPAALFLKKYGLRKMMAGSLLTCALMLSLFILYFRIKNLAADIVTEYPVAAVNFVKKEGWDERRVFHEYEWGGYLIWRGVPVFVDGRAGALYNEAFLRRFFDAARSGKDWETLMSDYRIEYAMLRRGRPLVPLFRKHPAWQEIYRDYLTHIFVRREYPG